LAGLPQAPAKYSPLTNPELAKARQGNVLDIMVRQEYITEADAESAKQEKLSYVTKRFSIEAPHFVMHIRDLMEEKYGASALYRGGLEITTSLDMDLQRTAESVVAKHAQRLRKNHNASNVGLVAMDPRSGEVLAMVGSADYFDNEIDGQVNMAQAPRQPGSAFKIFTYLTAFMKGYTPATMLLDVKTTFPDGINAPYQPQNVDKKFRGPVSLRQAFATSMNVPAVKAIQYAGVDNVIDVAHKMGITTLTRKQWYGLSLTLGGGEVRLLDMTYAYGVVANGGKMAGALVIEDQRQTGMRRLDPVAILEVKDWKGDTLERHEGHDTREIISPQLSYLLTNILSDNAARAPLFGADSPLLLPGRPAAVKTGSTDDYRDTWTVGFTPELVTGVWVGNSNNTPMTGALSTTTAAPVWHDFMVAALEGKPPSAFSKPTGIFEVEVCSPSGMLPTPYCPTSVREVFIGGTEPREQDNMFQLMRGDDGQERVFMVLPPEAAEWAKENNIPQPPDGESSTPQVLITSPAAGGSVKGTVTVQGSASSPDFVQYTLEYGEGTSPVSWVLIGEVNTTAVTNGTLGTFYVDNLKKGVYSLRLSVLDSNSGLKRVVVPINVEGSAPPSRTPTPPARDPKLAPTPTPVRKPVGPVPIAVPSSTATPRR
ncbi:MAG: putative penicillin-binding protein, partial [Dehalococcoidia bacterium]|nr:putative penicillin-binding protein [Dehalococcoidia bacterium]